MVEENQLLQAVLWPLHAHGGMRKHANTHTYLTSTCSWWPEKTHTHTWNKCNKWDCMRMSMHTRDWLQCGKGQTSTPGKCLASHFSKFNCCKAPLRKWKGTDNAAIFKNDFLVIVTLSVFCRPGFKEAQREVITRETHFGRCAGCSSSACHRLGFAGRVILTALTDVARGTPKVHSTF